MNYGGLGEAYNTDTINGISVGGVGDYHSSFHTHYQPQTKPYTNGFHNSSKLKGSDPLDDNEDEQQQQEQQIDDYDYEIDDVDRPKLLMWGLSKYRIRIKFFYFLLIYSIVGVVKHL
jgi:hypothetical protein